MKSFKVVLDDERAVLPKKAHNTDSGFDLTIIEKSKQIGNVIMYETGVKVAPPSGFYFDLVPRSSIIKSGYILANSVGIIDNEYRGTIKVPLIKVDQSKPDLELPNRLVQLIPRKVLDFSPVLVKSFDEKTLRDCGGFGSTG